MTDLYVPDALTQWATERAQYRADKNWAEADRLRDRIAFTGYIVRDSADGFEFERPAISAAADVASHLDDASTLAWSVVILARDRDADLRRAVESAAQHLSEVEAEIIIIGNGETTTHDTMADLAVAYPEVVRPLYTTENLGEGTSLGAAFRAAQGEFVMVLGVHIELTGNPCNALATTLSDDTIGATGGWGAVTPDLMFYESSEGPEVDAIEFYLFTFRRALLAEVGLPDERYRFYRNLDLDWSLSFKDKGYRLVITPGLPTETHEHIWHRTDPEEGERLSKKNYRYLLDKWRGRTDLLVSS